MKGAYSNFTAPPLRKMPDFKFVRPRSFWWVHSTPVKDAPPLLRVRGSACIGWRAIADHASFLRGLLAGQQKVMYTGCQPSVIMKQALIWRLMLSTFPW